MPTEALQPVFSLTFLRSRSANASGSDSRPSFRTSVTSTSISSHETAWMFGVVKLDLMMEKER